MSERYLYEIELVADEGRITAIPFGIDAVTQGSGYQDAIEMADDLIRSIIQDCLLHDKPVPKPTLENSPQHNGKVVLLSGRVSLDDLASVSATEAARQLNISRSRISHMLRDGLLEGYRKGRDTFVTTDSLNERKRDRRGPGRPASRLAQA